MKLDNDHKGSSQNFIDEDIMKLNSLHHKNWQLNDQMSDKCGCWRPLPHSHVFIPCAE